MCIFVGFRERVFQLLEVAGFGQKIKGAQTQGCHRCLHGGVASQDDGATVRLAGAQEFEGLQAAFLSETEVYNRGIETRFLEEAAHLVQGVANRHTIVFAFEDGAQGQGDADIIIDEQDVCGLFQGALLRRVTRP